MADSSMKSSSRPDRAAGDSLDSRFSRRPSFQSRRTRFQRKFPMDYHRLQSLQSKDPLEVALTLKSDRSGFSQLIGQKNLRRDIVVLVLKVLQVACTCPRKENLCEMLRMVSGVSSFMQQVHVFLEGLKEPLSQGEAESVGHLLTFFESLSLAHPDVSGVVVEGFLPELRTVLGCEDADVKLKERVENLSSWFASNSSGDGDAKQIRGTSFRNVSIFPGPDILDPDPCLKPNLLQGKYPSVESYLDVQFRLFREDYIRPLREGILSYREQLGNGVSSNFRDVRVYRNMRLNEALLTVDDGVVHKVRFVYDGNINWESSKRLIYGSLLCLSVDNFKTMLVATVVASKPYELRKGIVYIRFAEEHVSEAHALKNRTFVAIETDAYFEAYRHVLSVLQEFDPDSFPLGEYIINVLNEPRQPYYLQENKSYCFETMLLPTKLDKLVRRLYTLHLKEKPQKNDLPCSCSSLAIYYLVSDLDSWPHESEFELDASQMGAFKSALSQKLALIQGPPGTGKTHVGLKIVHALLHNKLYQTSSYFGSPVLVVCYTNHALDQFLEGVLKITNKVVRVGGRSTSDALADHTLKHLKMTSSNDFTRSYRFSVRQSLEFAIEAIESLKQLREDARVALLSVVELEEDIPEHHLFSLFNKHPECMALSEQNRGEFISYWLGSLLPSHLFYEVDGLLYLWVDDMRSFEEAVHMLEDMEFSEVLFKNFYSGAGMTEEWTAKKPYPTFTMEVQQNSQKHKNPPNISDFGEATDVEFIQSQRMEEGDVLEDAKVIYRKNNYNESSSSSRPETFVTRQLKCEPLSEIEAVLCRDVWALRLPERWRLYKMWLNNFHARTELKIESLKEEYERQLVLYNELRQERERLVTEGYEVVGMTTTGAAKYKHLMRGLKPRVVIVEEAAEVLEAHVISSLSENTQHLILIGDHQQLRPNPACYDLAKNYGLDVSLFERLINNGLPFCRLGIQHRMRPCISSLLVPHIYSSLEDHSSVHEYPDVKGMESNMFFLNHSYPEEESSTSKCNSFEAEFLISLCKHLVLQGYEPGQITILATYLAQFALIRHYASKVPLIQGAKITVVDNYQGEENDIILLSFVRSNSRGSIGFLKTDNRVCVALSRAKQGLYSVGNFSLLSRESCLWRNIVSKLYQSKSIGGSLTTKCQNHGTTFTVTDANDFEDIPDGGCTLPCEYLLKCGHKCKRKCHPLDPEHEFYLCRMPCPKVNLSCESNHPCTLTCSAECGPCMFKVKKVLSPCFHEKLLPCSTDPENLVCNHPCPEMLECGHICSSTCGEPCPECETMISAHSPCGHAVRVPCFKSPYEEALLLACREPCVKILKCGHPCTDFCGRDCSSYCMVQHERLLPCGHVANVPCHRMRLNNEEIMKTCSAPCGSTLLCGHTCNGTCGQCFQGRVHIACEQRCKKELLCGHVIRKSLCFRAIPSCKAPCRNECPHRRCPFPCGFQCLPCRSMCVWSCEHHRCSRMCEEPCDRPNCNLRCPKLLYCGHECLGYCGETCPPRCITCNGKDHLTDLRLLADEPAEYVPGQSGKLIVLENCNHVFECEELEKWLKKQVGPGKDAFRKIWMPSCPLCKTPIRRIGRLATFVRDYQTSFQIIKRNVFGSRAENETKRNKLLKRIVDMTPFRNLNVNEVHGFLQQMSSSLSKNNLPHNVLICLENYAQILEELSLLTLSLSRSTTAQELVPSFVTSTAQSLVTALYSRLGRINQSLICDVAQELCRLRSLLDMEHNFETLTKESPLLVQGLYKIERNNANASLDVQKKVWRNLEAIPDLVGEWYVCSIGHVTCACVAQLSDSRLHCGKCERRALSVFT